MKEGCKLFTVNFAANSFLMKRKLSAAAVFAIFLVAVYSCHTKTEENKSQPATVVKSKNTDSFNLAFDSVLA
jgi:hypothetical protein